MTTPKPPPPDDTLREHSYDGIQEYNKRLPNWWLLTFYGTIVFSIGYWAVTRQFGPAHSDHARIEADLQRIEAAKLAAASTTQLDDATLWKMSLNPVFTDAGRTTFNSTCASCHKESLRGVDEGGIGADLRDRQWIHGGRPTDILHTVTNGVPIKGMPTWGPVLGTKKITEVVAYVLSYHQEGEPGMGPATPAK
ncbi:MAG TPA: cbb3-type cytochrome c oxidase N-terminal domain-containing protein [Opitutaceae bacterium]|nr:cbb3-type cytochrome c oxidase N-terminal domain-containing protein [Opitutaceae bacterium]